MYSDLSVKGQIKSKPNYQAVDSPKKLTNKFGFFALKSCYITGKTCYWEGSALSDYVENMMLI